MLVLEIQNPATRANLCRTKRGQARPYSSLPAILRNQIIFNVQHDGSALALWLDGEGEEPPPYWMDENCDIHNI